MLVLILSLLSNADIEVFADCFPAIISQLDNPEFEIREIASQILINVGKLHVEDRANIRFHYLNHQIQFHLDKVLDKGSFEQKYRIYEILREIIPPKDPNREKTMIDTLREKYGGSKVVRNE
jgi:hypothetical protein